MSRTPLAPDDLTPPDAGQRADRAFVAIVFLTTAAAALWFVAHFGRNVPFMEDWELVPVFSGRRPATLGWLFEQMLEHRYILPKAVMYLTWRLSGDFRASMYVDLAAVVAIAAAFTIAVRRVRGRASFADAFFAVALFHFGHYENLIFSTQVYYVLPMALFAAATYIVLVDRWERPAAALAFGAVVALLPLNGGIGLLLAPPLAVWAIGAAVMRYRHAGDRRALSILTGASALSFLAIVLYFVNYQPLTQHGPIPRTPTTIRRTILQVFSIALGPEGRELWPVSALLSVLLCAGAGAVLLLAVVRGTDRIRASGLLACLCASALVLFGIGYGRAQVIAIAGFPSHYAWLAVLPLCCAYFAYAVYGGAVVRRLVPTLLFGAAVAMYGAGAREGLDYGRSLAAADDALLADIATGMPADAIAQRYSPRLYPNREPMADRVAMLRDAGLGPYKGMPRGAPTATYREVTIPITLVGANQASAEGEVVRGTGPDPYVVYALPQPTYVCGVRFDYDVTNADGVAPRTQVFWSLTGSNDFDAETRNAVVEREAGQPVPTVWILDTIDRLRLDPDARPCELRLRSITLIVPG